MNDVFQDRKARMLTLFIVGWALFISAAALLGNIDNYDPALSLGVIFFGFILFMVSGFCWILASLLNFKTKYPRKPAAPKEDKKEIEEKPIVEKPTVVYKPVIIEKEVPVEPPKTEEKPLEIPEEELKDYFVASRDLDKYHIHSCKWVKIIKPENRVYFKNKEQARSSGYKKCKTCTKKINNSD